MGHGKGWLAGAALVGAMVVAVPVLAHGDHGQGNASAAREACPAGHEEHCGAQANAGGGHAQGGHGMRGQGMGQHAMGRHGMGMHGMGMHGMGGHAMGGGSQGGGDARTR